MSESSVIVASLLEMDGLDVKALVMSLSLPSGEVVLNVLTAALPEWNVELEVCRSTNRDVRAYRINVYRKTSFSNGVRIAAPETALDAYLVQTAARKALVDFTNRKFYVTQVDVYPEGPGRASLRNASSTVYILFITLITPAEALERRELAKKRGRARRVA